MNENERLTDIHGSTRKDAEHSMEVLQNARLTDAYGATRKSTDTRGNLCIHLRLCSGGMEIHGNCEHFLYYPRNSKLP